MAHVVAQRTHAMGIRMALGALPGGILKMMLVRAAALVGVGLAIGLPVSWALGQSVRAFLFQVQPT